MSRVKSAESIRDKLKRKSLTDPVKELDDLVGARVVCLFRSDVARVGALVRAEFEVLIEDNKIDGTAVDAFGYQSVHFVCQISNTFSGPRYKDLHGHRFEVQIRTVAMDCWATLSHYLDYKSEPDVPKELRKDFFALSGLFYVADTHFELFYDARQRSQAAANRDVGLTPGPGQELNFDTFAAYLQRRYPDRDPSDSASLSELLVELSSVGYRDLPSLHDALERSSAAFAAYEKLNPPDSDDSRFSSEGVVRVSISMLDRAYRAKFDYMQEETLAKFRSLLLPKEPDAKA